jgi:hypothetical protein
LLPNIAQAQKTNEDECPAWSINGKEAAMGSEDFLSLARFVRPFNRY